jgi:glutathione S-transferase
MKEAGGSTVMKATLYGSRLSPFVEKVARALQLKRIDFAVVDPKGPNDLKKWNPTTGKMPVLDIGGEKPFDSTLILRRLDELVPEPPLVSRDPEIAARQRFLEDWSDESLYWYVMALRWNPVNSKATIAQLSEFVPAALRPVVGMVLGWKLGAQARSQGLGRLSLGTVLDELGRRFDELEVLLGDKPFFFSDVVSVADLALFGQFATMRSGPTPQAARLLDARPKLAAFFDRVDAATAAPPSTARNLHAA